MYLKKISLTLTASLLALFAFVAACDKKEVTPDPMAPFALLYNPTSGTVEEGKGFVSTKPLIDGSTPITYSLSSPPAFVTIDATTGAISAAAGLAAGAYSFNVIATNSVRAVTFSNAFKLTVTPKAVPSAPSALVYNPATGIVQFGQAFASATPTISGTSPITYSLGGSPAAGISINASTGLISSTAALPMGTYTLDVIATNSINAVTFVGAYKLTVAAAAASVTFTTNILPLINSKCSSCHTPGGSNSNWTVYANAKASIDEILSRVQRTSSTSGFMPQGRSALSTSEIDLLKKWKSDGLKE